MTRFAVLLLIVSVAIAAPASAQCTPVQITSQSSDSTIDLGQSVTLSFTASGSQPFRQQWYRSVGGGPGQPEAIANNPITVRPGVTTQYYAWVSNACGQVVTDTITITVRSAAPTITLQPTPTKACVSESVTLRVEANGTPPLQFNWYYWNTNLGEAELVETYNAPMNCYSPCASTHADTRSGLFWVVVSNAHGSNISNPARRMNYQQPSVVASAAPADIAAGQQTILFAEGGDVTTYSWFNGPMFIGRGKTFAVAPPLTTTYTVEAANRCLTGTAQVTVNVGSTPAPPCTLGSITTEPGDVSINAGDSTILNVATNGNPPHLYSWYESIPGASRGVGNGQSLFVQPLVTTSYFVWINRNCSDFSGMASRLARVRVCTAPPPIYTQPADVTIAPGSSTTLITQSSDEATAVVWYRYVPGASEVIGTTRAITVTPAASETYFAWVYSECGATATRAVRVTVQ